MESSGKTRKLIQRLLLWLCVLFMGYAVISHIASRTVQNLTYQKDSIVRVAVLTDPAMQFTFNPSTRKVIVTVSSGKCPLQHRERCFRGRYDRFFIPEAKITQADFWEYLKNVLSSWRFNPLYAVEVLWMYINAWHDNRTDLTPAEFFLLVQNMTDLNVNDFAVKYPPQQPQRHKHRTVKRDATDDAPLELPQQQDDQPLLLEILNASGKRGIAQTLTQYLREQNNKGLLRVDVIDYGNYPTTQKTSSITDYSGKLIQATQLSRAIGITSEIKTETSATAICDTRIILGEDFRMPL